MGIRENLNLGFGAQEGIGVLEPADLAGVVVPQLLVQAVGVSLLSLDLGDDIKDVGVGAAGAGASVSV